MSIVTLHLKILPLSSYVDGVFTKGDKFSICEENVHKLMCLYGKFGFIINLKKSQIVSTQKNKFLGFATGSVKMIVTLTQEKKKKLKNLILNLFRINKPTIKYLTKVVGTIISCMLAAIVGPLLYCYL